MTNQVIPEAAVDNWRMTITEFLEARIAEDEAIARVAKAEFAHAGDGCYGPARVLAECAAKRAVIAAAERLETMRVDANLWSMESPEDTLIAPLAATYKDHPDYKQEWA